MYRATEIANYFIAHKKKGYVLTALKLNKLIYIAHGIYLAKHDKPLIDENPEAWMYGVIIPSIYHKYQSFKNDDININIPHYSVHREVDEFLGEINNKFGECEGSTLGALTSVAGSPWSYVWDRVENSEYQNLQITKIMLRDYYKKYLELE